MHFVLWGLHQQEPKAAQTTEAEFQCTSCFGVFINGAGFYTERYSHVSMHFVLWGLHQLRSAANRVYEICFNALRALGSSSTGLFY